MTHWFEAEVAEEVGVKCAVLFSHIAYWVEQNERNETNLKDGKYWTYNTMAAFQDMFPYMSYNQIRRGIEKLRQEGFIVTRNYGKRDKTLWYTLGDKGIAYRRLQYMRISDVDGQWQKCQMQLAKMPNANGKNAKSTIITNNNTYNNTDTPRNGKDYKDVDKVIEEYNKICTSLPRCLRATKKRRDKIATRLTEYTLDDFTEAFRKAEESDFMKGQAGGRGWRANFDWFIENDENVAKVLEGRYDNTKGGGVEGKTRDAETSGDASGNSGYYENLPDVW